jgi:hypothetical protein
VWFFQSLTVSAGHGQSTLRAGVTDVNGTNRLLVESAFGLRCSQQVALATCFTHTVLLSCMDLETANHADAKPAEKEEHQIHCIS